jgi:DNA-binding transcriptional LysR family regulator
MDEVMIPNLDVDYLKTFLAIAETGNFTKAADDVNKTQSAVSMQMKRLEEMLGRTLFEREGRGSRLTADGARFVDHARRMVSLNDELVSVYSRPNLTGTVRLGTSDDYTDIFLPEVLVKFARSHPLVTVDVECVSSSILFERVKRNEIDLALVSLREEDRSAEIMHHEQLRWVTSAKHQTHQMPVVPLAVANAACEWRQHSEDTLKKSGRPYRVAYTSQNRAALDAAVLQGLAIAAMPEICVRPGMRVLSAAEGFPAFHRFQIGLIMKQGTPSQSALALADHIRESFTKRQTIMAAE